MIEPLATPSGIRSGDRPALRDRRRDAAWLWAGLLIACLAFYGRLLTGWMPIGADHSLMYAPFFSLPWQGGPPLWNPYALSGAPLLDNLQAALLYPLRWPFYWIADWRAYYGPFHWLHYAVALAGTALWLRGMRLRPWPVAAGALAYVMGGHIAGRILNPTIFYAACWLPWLLAGAAATRPRRGWLGALGLTMICWIGSPHLMFYGAIGWGLAFALVAAPAAWHAGGVRGAASLALVRALQLAVALALAAPTLLPGIERAGQSIRTATDVEHNLADSVTWPELPKVLLGGTGAAIHPEYIDKACYLGPVALALIALLLASPRAWRDRRVRLGVALVAAGLFFALGKQVGLDRLMPTIPGYRDLAGAPRALVLTAAGLALLLGLAFARVLPRLRAWRAQAGLGLLGLAAAAGALALAWPTATTMGAAPFGDDWLGAWLRAPRAVPWPLWPLFDAGVGLLLAALILEATRRAPRLRPGLLLALCFVQWWHFAPRVAPPLERAGFFDPPPAVAWLMQQQAASPEPFRIAGFDPLRLHDADMTNAHKFAFLEPNLATLYRLEDIQGFDPLIWTGYADLVRAAAGRAPYNDPIHNLDIDRPEPAVFDQLGVRYLLGHPYERRLSWVPQEWRQDAATGAVDSPVTAWDERGTSEPITHWLTVSMAIGAERVPRDVELARLHIEAEEGLFSFPLRNGIETADVMALNRYRARARRLGPSETSATLNMNWTVNLVMPKLGYELQQSNWRGLIDLGRPLHVRRAWWTLSDPRIIVAITGQAYRLARPADTTSERWRLAWGSEKDVAPVFEYLPATSNAPARVPARAVLVPASAAEYPHRKMAHERQPVTIDPARLAKADGNLMPGTSVRWLERTPGSMRLAVECPAESVLVLKELWDSGWRARLDDNRVPSIMADVNGLWRGVVLKPGSHEIEMTYRPGWLGRTLAWLAAVLALAVVLDRLILRAPGRARRNSG